MTTIPRFPPSLVRAICALGIALALGSAMSGCVARVGPGGWCYWHPHRCP